ncbi:aldehyde dehydrogenase family protein [Streptomyces mirabilis]|uniref:aldehyde dehydrogenase family protein n=1 Tax=Streptomyces mirabilis TaxID=68239 RepID=UPI0036B3CE7D
MLGVGRFQPFLRGLARQVRELQGVGEHRLADSAVDLVSALLAQHGSSSAHELGPDRIAAAHDISRRYLYKLLAEQGHTVSGWIRERRLTQCRRDLGDPALAHLPVGAVAGRWGFPDAGHFSHVVKPAEQTPMTTVRLVQLCQEAGIPDGVVTLLTGGPKAGRALVEHPGVDKVSFTGSTETGRAIVHASTGNLKRVSLELGGKAPSIVLPDADLGAAVGGCLQRAAEQWQCCAAYTRFHRSCPFHRIHLSLERAWVPGPGTGGTRSHLDAVPAPWAGLSGLQACGRDVAA